MTNSKLREAYFRQATSVSRCAVCWIPIWNLVGNRWPSALELAHIIPRSRGGKRGQCIHNVILLCSYCHGSQHRGHLVVDGERWPDVTEGMLMRAKEELGEMDEVKLGAIASTSPEWVRWKIDSASMDGFEAERERWRLR